MENNIFDTSITMNTGLFIPVTMHFKSRNIFYYWKYALKTDCFFTVKTSNITGIINNLIAAGIYNKGNIYDALISHVEVAPETIENAMIDYLKADSKTIQLVDNFINWLSPWDLYDGIRINLIIHCMEDNITDITTLINEYESM